MIRIAITAEAFEAIERTLPGNVGFEPEAGEKGERWIWLEPHIIAISRSRPKRTRATPDATSVPISDEDLDRAWQRRVVEDLARHGLPGPGRLNGRERRLIRDLLANHPALTPDEAIARLWAGGL